MGHCDWRDGGLGALGAHHRGGTNSNRVGEDDSCRATCRDNPNVVTEEILSVSVRINLEVEFVLKIEIGANLIFVRASDSALSCISTYQTSGSGLDVGTLEDHQLELRSKL